MQHSPTAFLFDLNGTMINDMEFHIRAWHQTLIKLGSTISYDEMKAECYGKNEEILERIMPGQFTADQTAVISMTKERTYQDSYRPHVALLPGLQVFLDRAKAKNIKMAIGSASILWNIDFILDTLHIRHYFDAIVGAENVSASKPNPETFLRCAEQLQVDPANCVVLEDSTKGVESALRGGMNCIAITTLHSADEFAQYSNVVLTIADYMDERLVEQFFSS